MKSPGDIAERLARQWQQAPLRVERLLNRERWPLDIAIGKPSGADFSSNTAQVQAHVQRWRAVTNGEVLWAPVKYRAGAEAVSLPHTWRIRTPSEWVDASESAEIQEEFSRLGHIVGNVDSVFHELLVRERPLWQKKHVDEVVSAAKLASTLAPGVAAGRPLRLMAEAGVDTKFFERHATLITRLLDQRFCGAASEQGLHSFLNASDDSDHWVLVAPLDKSLLPFRRQRVATRELADTPLPGTHILIVENEQCIHLLPELPDTIAILGAGLDLNWLGSPAFDGKYLAYWGDMDTWGLSMLAGAKLQRPEIVPLLMTRALFDRYAEQSAVTEPVVARPTAPEGLDSVEADFYRHLIALSNGRLEQEYLPGGEVAVAVKAWRSSS
ncbi:DUF2220 family protein [Microbulbifer bruguierae]|uniref:DUF2220 family protein n=1 Tax=Microbulbifer bruguierae TaxID=3029061 RepID=A0ABY8NA92_9GAMM|nr:Wadjet anti-phage system protein JetD domain-containing protein [Microbulbifer bruguierae]WGL15816.1 DUF2220 family protein [Microbulbifer bruguierae]